MKSIKNKLTDIINLNLLQKFVADCYNSISEDAIKIIYHRKKINQHVKEKYYTFIIIKNIKI